MKPSALLLYGTKGTRTHDLSHVKRTLSRLSYDPIYLPSHDSTTLYSIVILVPHIIKSEVKWRGETGGKAVLD